MENQNPVSGKQIAEYYNQFKEHQKKLGINIRHRTIFRNLRNAGLKRDSKVLEVGCGIGTVSSLILKYITKGSFVGVDISSESIEVARKLNSAFTNAEFITNDMTSFDHKLKFDFVVLPDVLEHIPEEQHAALFRILSKVSSDNVTVLINIPEPHVLDWIRHNTPEKLQIIDQSLSIKDMVNRFHDAGFGLHSVNPYSLQYVEPDYLSIVFRKPYKISTLHLKGVLTRFAENTLSKVN